MNNRPKKTTPYHSKTEPNRQNQNQQPSTSNHQASNLSHESYRPKPKYAPFVLINPQALQSMTTKPNPLDLVKNDVNIYQAHANHLRIQIEDKLMFNESLKAKKMQLIERQKHIIMQNQKLSKGLVKIQRIKIQIKQRARGTGLMKNALKLAATQKIAKATINNQQACDKNNDLQLNLTKIQQQIIKENLSVEQSFTNLDLSKFQLQSAYSRIQQQTKSNQQKERVVNKVARQLKENIMHVAIIKMQFNSFMRVSVNIYHETEKSKLLRLLENNASIWNKKNTRLLHQDEIRYFFMMILYKSWWKILDRLSYKFEGYKRLFFWHDITDKERFQHILEYLGDLMGNPTRDTASARKYYIVVYSPFKESCDNLIRIAKTLEGLDNGIIRIERVLSQSIIGQNEELVIHYVMGGVRKTKIFEIVRLQELTKETLSKYIAKVGNRQRACLLKVDIPYCFDTPEEFNKSEQAFNLIRGQK